MTRTRLFILSLLSVACIAASAMFGTAASLGADEGAKPPVAILADVDAAMATVRTLRLQGTERTAEGRSSIRLDVKDPRTIDLTISLGSERARIRSVHSRLYYKANRAFWRQSGRTKKAVAKLISDRWVKVPAKPSETNEFTEALRPRNILRCVSDVGGSFVTGAPETAGGQAAIVLIGAGDQPGTAPGKLYVAASGPPRLLRIVQSGPTRAGGSVDEVCGEGDDTTKSADYLLSAFDEPLRISTPRDAIDFPKAGKKKPKSL